LRSPDKVSGKRIRLRPTLTDAALYRVDYISTKHAT
jgi:hypothetical protein